MLKKVCILILGLSSFIVSAQNLVPNPSFEESTPNPNSHTNYDKRNVSNWNFLSFPIYYSSEYKQQSGVWVPRNEDGFQYAYSGKAYIGEVFYGDGGSRGYIYTRLKNILRKDKKYYVRFYINIADESGWATSNIQVLFTKGRPIDSLLPTHDLERSHWPKAQLRNPMGNVITDTVNWVKLSWVYQAKGDEVYMAIGNFNRNAGTRALKVKNNGIVDAFYLLDDVCVSEVNEDGTCNCEDSAHIIIANEDTIKPKELSIEPNKNITLNNVFFESGKSQLLLASFKELDQLVCYLKINEKVEIEIMGYTDNSGSEDKNKALSAARAKAVADYLIAKGISKMRVGYKGLGCVNPVAGNETVEGKAKNRRVEFKITQ
jgi:OOP family OmpA-OmpF porin